MATTKADKDTQANVYKALRGALRDHALETVTLPATGRMLVGFEGLSWLGVLEVTEAADGTRAGKWRNVTVLSPKG